MDAYDPTNNCLCLTCMTSSSHCNIPPCDHKPFGRGLRLHLGREHTFNCRSSKKARVDEVPPVNGDLAGAHVMKNVPVTTLEEGNGVEEAIRRLVEYTLSAVGEGAEGAILEVLGEVGEVGSKDVLGEVGTLDAFLVAESLPVGEEPSAEEGWTGFCADETSSPGSSASSPEPGSSASSPGFSASSASVSSVLFEQNEAELRRMIISTADVHELQRVKAPQNCLSYKVAIEALEQNLNQGKEERFRDFLREHANAAVRAGCDLDEDRKASINLPSAAKCRKEVLEIMALWGLTPVSVPHSLADGLPPLLAYHLPLGPSLRVFLSNPQLPEGSLGRIIPDIQGGPSMTPPQTTPLLAPGYPIWMGDLPVVREGFSAAISAARVAWWWEPVHALSKTLGKTIDLVGVPLISSHDATLIGTQDTADPVLSKIAIATGRFAKSEKSIMCRGFIRKPTIGESSTVSDRTRTIEVWHEQLYNAFARELDDYFKGPPLIMDLIPGLERGSDPNTLKVVLPYSVVFALDWMALISSAHRKKESCCLCSVRKCQLHETNPDVVRLESVQEDLDKAWRAYADTVDLLGKEQPGSLKFTSLKGRESKLRNVLERFGFTVELPRPWFTRSKPPPSGSFFSCQIKAPLPSVGVEVVRAALALEVRMPREAIHVSTTGNTFLAQFLFPVPSEEASASASLHSLSNFLLSSTNAYWVAGTSISFTSTPLCGPKFGLIPWSVSVMEFLRRIPIDLLHVGPQGMYQHVRKAVLALIRAQPTFAPTGGTGTDAVRILDKVVRECPAFHDINETTTSFSSMGVLKHGSLTGKDSFSLHSLILDALCCKDIVYDAVLRRRVIRLMEVLEEVEAHASHAPFHRAASPTEFDSRRAAVKELAQTFMTECIDVLGEHQSSCFEISKMHALLEASEWIGTYASLTWVAMDLFECYHKLVKILARSKTNNKEIGLTLCRSYILRQGLLVVLPQLLRFPPSILSCCSPLTPLKTFKWGDTSPPLVSTSELEQAVKTSTGVYLVEDKIPDTPWNWHSSVHLTRSNLPHVRICDDSLRPGNLLRPSLLNAQLQAVDPYKPAGSQVPHVTEYAKNGPLILSRGFFSSESDPKTLYVLGQKYHDWDSTAPSPYSFRIRRTLSESLVILPLTSVHDKVPFGYYRATSTDPCSMNEIIWRPFQRM